jgi:outer membrane protein TolC
MKLTLLISLLLFSFNIFAAKTYNVALVFDFKNQKNQSHLKRVRSEIEALSTYDIKIKQPKKYTYYVNSSSKNINKVLNVIYKNKRIHGVILMDYIGSSTANRRKTFPKPTVAANVISAKSQGFRIRKRFNYLESTALVNANLTQVKRITNSNHATILTSIPLTRNLRGIKSHLDSEFAKFKMTYEMISIRDSNYKEKLATVKDSSTVLVGELLDFNQSEFQEFIKYMNKRKFRSFSLSSRKHVEQGFLGSVYGDDLDYIHVTRLAGLNLQRMFLGDSSRELTTKLERSTKLVLNMDTAKIIGFSPSWDSIMNAVIIRKSSASNELKLKEAVLAAIADNHELKGARALYQSEEANRMRSINKYLPQVNLVGSQKVIDKDTAQLASAYGTNPEKQLVGTVSVDQVLLSDKSITNISMSNSRLEVAKQQEVLSKNDLIKNTASAYLNVLRTKLIADIQERNYKQTQLNLKLAKGKNRVGASRKTDVYRWESELATSKIRMISSRVEYRQNYAEFNRLLSRPVTNRYKLEEVDQKHKMFYLFSYVRGVTNNPAALEALREFVISEAKLKSPLYLSAVSNEKLVKKNVGLANRSFFLPDLSLNFNYNKTFNRSGIGSTAPTGTQFNDNAWGASLNVTFPLITGGEKFSNRKEVVNQLVSATSKRKSLEFQLDTYVSNQIDTLFSLLNAIQLNKRNVKFSKNNFEAVKDLYKNGKVNIINVVDAQNNYLTASQNEVDSVYDFLNSYIELGSLIGQYDFLMSPTEQEAMLKRLKSFYKK